MSKPSVSADLMSFILADCGVGGGSAALPRFGSGKSLQETIELPGALKDKP